MKKTTAEPMETKRFWCRFDPADFKGVQDYLNEKAAQGWELVNADGFVTAKFARTEGKCSEASPRPTVLRSDR